VGVKAVPWGLLAAAVLIAAGMFSGRNEAVDRAQMYEAAVATLRPLADSLRLEAERRDTVLVAVTDTVRVVVTRERIVQVEVVDTLRATLDSTQAVLLDSLLDSHAEEVAALERLAEQNLLWGQGWKDAYDALVPVSEAYRLRGDAWEAAARAQGRRAWYERGAVAVVTAGVLLLR